MRSLLLASALALVACDPGQGSTSATPDPSVSTPINAPSSAPSVAPSASANLKKSDLMLARAKSTLVATPPDLPRVTVTTSELRVNEKHVLAVPADASTGFAAADKQKGIADLMLPALGTEIDGARKDAKNVVVGFDARTPYRVVLEVLFTLGQHNITGYWLAVNSGDTERVFYSEPPKAQTKPSPSAVASASAAPSASGGKSGALPNFTVLFVPDGIAVQAAGVNLTNHCANGGNGVAVPNVNGTYDFAALTKCGATVKATGKISPSVTYAAGPKTYWQSLISAMDALNADYPGITFGVAR